MSAPNSPEGGIQGKAINASSEEFYTSSEKTSLGEVEEPILDENGQELTSEEVSELEFVMSKR